MATEEARSLLDSLMGGDRNALLPVGAALPPRKKRRGNDSNDNAGGATQLLLPGKRAKSCFDKDIDPLFTAWGIDVFDLFVNTKSDLGTNPYVVDQGAHEEFMQLPEPEQERTGYLYFLFQKLQELVRQCDRTVSRNKEKLHQELTRKLSQRGGQDFVEDVDQTALDMLCRSMIQVEDLQQEMNELLTELEDALSQEEAAMKKLEPLLEAERAEKEKENAAQEESKDISNEGTDVPVKMEEDAPATEAEGSVVKQEEKPIKQEDPDEKPIKQEDQDEKESAPEKMEAENAATETRKQDLASLSMQVGKLTLRKQRAVYDLAQVVSRLAPLQDSVETQHRNLNYVKSDISTDKTVCEVSGNFMSSRDADERIAAHYAGKQYVGWKLVRDKLEEMKQKYGRYGPPPPGRRPAEVDMRARGGGDFRGGPPMGRGAGRGRFDSGGFRGGSGGPPERGRWERGGPPQDYGRRGGGHDNWRR